jgi:hypothetical protein
MKNTARYLKISIDILNISAGLDVAAFRLTPQFSGRALPRPRRRITVRCNCLLALICD